MKWSSKQRGFFRSVHFSGLSFCVIALTAAMLTPIWASDLLPFTDYPVHLAMAQSAGIPGRSQSFGVDRFETHWFTPYSVAYQVMIQAGRVFPIEMTGKIMISLYLITTPLLLMRLLKTLGKPPYLALPFYLMLYNFNVSWGFLPFLTAVPILFEIIVQIVLYLKRPTLPRGFLLAGWLILLFFTHLFALVIAMAIMVGTGLTVAASGKRSALSIMITSIPVAVIVAAWKFSLHFNQADRFFLDKGIRMAPLSLKFRFLPDYIISGDPGWTSRILFSLLLVMISLRFFPGRDKSGPDMIRETERNPITADHLLIGRIQIALVASVWLLYLVCPYSWMTAVWLFNRITFLAAGLTLVLLPSKSRVSTAAWMTGITLTGLLLAGQITARHIAFDSEARPGLALLHRIPPAKNLRYLPLNTRSAFCDHNPYQHFGLYYQLHQNGIVHNPFAVLSHMPVRYRDEWMTIESSFRPEIRRDSTGLSADLAVSRNEYFLLRLAPGDSPFTVGRLFQDQMQQLPIVIGFENPWLLATQSGDSR